MKKSETAYEKGRRYEHKIKRMYEADGCFVMRSAGSHGPADLVVIGPQGVGLVQVKSTQRLPPPLYVEDRIALAETVEALRPYVPGLWARLHVWVEPHRAWQVWSYEPLCVWRDTR